MVDLCFLWPTQVHNPNSNQSVQLFLHSLTAEGPYTLQCTTLSPKIAPSHRGSGPHITQFLGPSEPTTQTTSLSFQPFLHRWPQNVPILYIGMPLCPLKISPSHGGSGPPSNTWFPQSTRVLNPNGIWIGSSVFAGLTSVTERPTHHTTRSVTIDCIYVRSMGDAV